MSAQRSLAVATLMVLAAGCAHYYKVTDPGSGREYYTEEVDYTKSGAIQFKDAKTGAVTTMQNSQVLEIKEDAFTKGVGATPPQTPAAPAPAH